MVQSYQLNEVSVLTDLSKLDFGEGSTHLGKPIRKLTSEEKKQIHDCVMLARAASHKHDEDDLRRDFSFIILYGREAFINASLQTN